MKRALIVTVALICLFGLALLCAAWQSVGDFIGFLVLGGCRSWPPSPTPSAPALMAISALVISRYWFSSAG
jgi:hypothetical protein